LLDAIDSIPVPGEWLTYSHADEAAGLTLMELSLRMDYIHRVSENLTLVDSTHMHREVSIDLDMRKVTSRQRRALSIRPLGPMVNRSFRTDAPSGTTTSTPAAEDTEATPEQESGRLIWVPIARHSRGDLASVEVRNGKDEVMVRLSDDAIKAALSGGLTRLFKAQLTTRLRSDSSHGLTPADLLSRYLFERAIAHCVHHGVRPRSATDSPTSGVESWNGAGLLPTATEQEPGALSPEEILNIRKQARSYLEELQDRHRQEFLGLLAMASEEQFLVVLLPALPSQVHLHYVAPPMPTDSRTSPVARRIRNLLPLNREYTVEYETQMPRTINSYHVSLAVPEEIKVRHFLLSSDIDASFVAAVRLDLIRLAGTVPLDENDPGPMSAVWEDELVNLLTRISALAEARGAGLRRYRSYISRVLAQHGGRLPDPRSPSDGDPDPIGSIVRGPGSIESLLSLARLHAHGLVLDELMTMDRRRLVTFLFHLAEFLPRFNADFDVVTDSDPRDNGANAQWNPQQLSPGARFEPVRLGFFVALADEPPSLVESVARMVLGLLAMVTFIAAPSFVLDPIPGLPGAIWDHENVSGSDALVAVLLLIPGILLSRLDIPHTHSILGELRVFPRRIAYTSVVITSVLALLAAADVSTMARWSPYASGLLLGLLGLCGIEFLARTVRRRRLVPRSQFTPGWLMQAMTGVDHLSDRRMAIDAGFQAIGQAEYREPDGFVLLRWNAAVLRLRRQGRRIRQRVWRSLSPAPPSPSTCGGVPCDMQHGSFHRATVTGKIARLAAERTTAMHFDISHLAGHDSTFSPHGGHGPDDDCGDMSEMLGLLAYGNGVEIRTRPVDEASAIVAGPDPVPGAVSRHDEFGITRVTGVFFPDSVRLDSSRYTEILIGLGNGRDLSTVQGRMITEIVSDLFSFMERSRVVPFFVVLPAQVPIDLTATDENRVPPPELCLRIAVMDSPGVMEPAPFDDGRQDSAAPSVKPTAPDSRIVFVDRVLTYARDRGLGVWLSRERENNRPGRWRRITSFDAELFLAHRHRSFPDLVGDDHPRSLRQLSFVLPSGTAATNHLRRLTEQLDKDGIGCRSLMVWQLQQAVFTTVMIPVRNPTPDPGHIESSAAAPGQEYRRLRAECARVDDVAGDPDHVMDRNLFLVTSTMQPSRPENEDIRVTAYWISWDLPERGDVDEITKHLVATFRKHTNGGHAWLVFLRARQNDRDHLRGRAKVVVQIPTTWDGRRLGQLAHQVQHDVQKQTESAFPWRNTAVNLTVSWGER
jgi:hypothetical protein